MLQNTPCVFTPAMSLQVDNDAFYDICRLNEQSMKPTSGVKILCGLRYAARDSSLKSPRPHEGICGRLRNSSMWPSVELVMVHLCVSLPEYEYQKQMDTSIQGDLRSKFVLGVFRPLHESARRHGILWLRNHCRSLKPYGRNLPRRSRIMENSFAVAGCSHS